MIVTVAICTWNRANLLGKTLTEMVQVKNPLGADWELLIVNNNCSDDTDDVIKTFCGRLPIRRVLELRQGLSNARNSAIHEARGDIIIWTDDDVLVDGDWLVHYVDGFRRYPDAAFFGGPIAPSFECKVPAWLARNMLVFGVVYGYRNLGAEEMVIGDANHLPFGANMAVRKYLYTRFSYDPELGVQGQKRVMGEESEFFRQLLERGYRGVWLPQVGIKHVIQREQVNRKYIRRYFQSTGTTLVTLRRGSAEHESCIYGVPLWLLRFVGIAYLKWMISVASFSKRKERFWAELQVLLGQVKECRKQQAFRHAA